MVNLLISGCPGTPGYQAPELFTRKQVYLKSDIYSFGILLWQILANENQPYPGWHAHTIIFKVVSQNARPIKEPVNRSPKLETVINHNLINDISLCTRIFGENRDCDLIFFDRACGAQKFC